MMLMIVVAVLRGQAMLCLLLLFEEPVEVVHVRALWTAVVNMGLGAVGDSMEDRR